MVTLVRKSFAVFAQKSRAALLYCRTHFSSAIFFASAILASASFCASKQINKFCFNFKLQSLMYRSKIIWIILKPEVRKHKSINREGKKISSTEYYRMIQKDHKLDRLHNSTEYFIRESYTIMYRTSWTYSIVSGFSSPSPL